MSDNEQTETLTKTKKPRTEKQVAATAAMRAALQKKKEAEMQEATKEPPKTLSSKPTAIEKKLMLQALKHKLNNPTVAEDEDEEEEEDTRAVGCPALGEGEHDTVVPDQKAPKAKSIAQPTAKTPRTKARAKPLDEVSEDEEEIIVIKKQKKPKKKTIIIEESESEDEQPQPQQPIFPTRHTRTQQNKNARIGVSNNPKQIVSFFMD